MGGKTYLSDTIYYHNLFIPSSLLNYFKDPFMFFLDYVLFIFVFNKSFQVCFCKQWTTTKE